MIPTSIAEGLSAFRDQFADQLALAGPPENEHAVHFCLALGLQRALNLAPGDIVFERTLNGGRVDLLVSPPLDLAIEVKFHRMPPSGKSPPSTKNEEFWRPVS